MNFRTAKSLLKICILGVGGRIFGESPVEKGAGRRVGRCGERRDLEKRGAVSGLTRRYAPLTRGPADLKAPSGASTAGPL